MAVRQVQSQVISFAFHLPFCGAFARRFARQCGLKDAIYTQQYGVNHTTKLSDYGEYKPLYCVNLEALKRNLHQHPWLNYSVIGR